MRVVLDTNVMLVSIPKLSKYRAIFEGLIQKKYTLIISNEILTEYEEIIGQKANEVVAQNITNMLISLSNVEKTEIYYRWGLIKVDEEDNKFVDCAIAGSADYLVSNDSHFNVLETTDFPEVPVITIEKFLEILKYP
ncbi:MAG: putative toxin-antitoxin system toxin component, PIN family [Candidatus Aminicenantes bacterium]|nr:putative toxin-antitoxin system toxin component, PIN family [Candidatus Aminicenantes bacterium]NIM80888.1 putative toxin-antitoxin system toxin component, PIN family [Candidatus Aminicenantes bacterium]NIN20272.1 putative toxin-antitoxin system toxin component, PIN family [Candidatus Aminicenantes bacterium]NIN44051.1 putative toxin-antitoxin system toxin component, PIN family [Candidatus Aminicenantes bacterium]NIN86861.1 putative toxin-antitoxin system toxin component, PIN family [Candida